VPQANETLPQFVRRGAASVRRRSQPLLELLPSRRRLRPRTGELKVDFASYAVPDVPALLTRLADARDVVVVIPVYNGGDMVRSCIESVLEFTPARRIIVIDDGSSDAATVAMLREFGASGRIELVTHRKNRGYTRTALHAMSLDSQADVVLLNSDTLVGPLWLERLRWTAYSVDKSAGASPYSNNAGAYALPVSSEANEWPLSQGWTNVARYVGQRSTTWALEGPIIHGFCVYFKRDALEAVGLFDRRLFPRGYGEEVDWSMRALGQGFVSLGAPHVFVSHAVGGTFGEARLALLQRSTVINDRLHPSRWRLLRQWWESAGFDAVRENSAASRAALEAGDTPQRRMLVVGGVPAATPGFEAVVWSPTDTPDDATLASLLIDRFVERVYITGEVPPRLERVCGLLGIPFEYATAPVDATP